MLHLFNCEVEMMENSTLRFCATSLYGISHISICSASTLP